MDKTVTEGAQAIAHKKGLQGFLRSEVASIKEHPRLYKIVTASVFAAVETDSIKQMLLMGGTLIQINPESQDVVRDFLQNTLYSFPTIYTYCTVVDYGILTGMALAGAAVYRFAGHIKDWIRPRLRT